MLHVRLCMKDSCVFCAQINLEDRLYEAIITRNIYRIINSEIHDSFDKDIEIKKK